MEKEAISRTEVIMAGLGGMGVLMAGRIMAWAALEKYRHVSWFPTYAVEKRGGLCECTVIFSPSPIPSPVIDESRNIVVFTSSQFKAFEPRVRPGGMMIVDSTGGEEIQPERNDYHLLVVPGMETAHRMGDIQVNNLILLGVFTGAARTLPAELVEGALKSRLGADEKIIERNRKAFQAGIEIGSAKAV